MKIIRNAAQCTQCNTFIESKHRHDFQSCQCEAIFVDGGLDYLRRGGKPEHFMDLSRYTESSYDMLDKP